MSPKNPRNINADIVRLVAMFMVILLHTIYNFVLRPDFFPSKLYFAFEPVIALSKTSVLLFFMLSGYLVIAKQRTLRDNLTRTIEKIIIPLGFFTLVNNLYAASKFQFDGTNTMQYVLLEIQRMTGFPSSGMWFLVALVFLYLLNPVWNLIFAKDRSPELAQFLTAGAFVFSLIAGLIAHPALRVHSMFTGLTGWTAFAFFYLYGGLWRNNWVKKLGLGWNVALVAGGVAGTMAGDIFTMTQQTQAVPSLWTGYTAEYVSLPVMMAAVGLFNLLMMLDFSGLTAWFKRLLAWLSGLSFGIYLIHNYVVSTLGQLGFDFNRLSMGVYAYNLLNIFLVFTISVILTVIVKQTPWVRMVIGEKR